MSAQSRILRGLLRLFLILTGVACTGAPRGPEGATPAASPADEVERTSFAPALNIELAGMTRSSEGVYHRDLEVGTGGAAAPGREVRVTYVAYLASGREVDRSAAGEPALAFTVGDGRVIRGWDLGVRGMKVGGVRQLVVPSRLAYGARAVGEVPARAVMVFVLRLEGVR